MKRILLLLCGIMLVPVIACSQHLVEVGKGYSCTSVNTTVFRNNSLVTHGDEQYISYYDNDGYLVLGKRKLDSEQWTLHRTQYQGNVKDAHNIISMMIDGEGYIGEVASASELERRLFSDLCLSVCGLITCYRRHRCPVWLKAWATCSRLVGRYVLERFTI